MFDPCLMLSLADSHKVMIDEDEAKVFEDTGCQGPRYEIWMR